MNFYINPTIAKSIAKCLVKKGININAKNKQDLSPLHLCLLSNQHDALLFALSHNQTLRSSRSLPCNLLFDFTQRGGKSLQTPLHLVVASNNLKIIQSVLRSEEALVAEAVDEEGRLAKDICPYNSPIYKMLLQYERR